MAGVKGMKGPGLGGSRPNTGGARPNSGPKPKGPTVWTQSQTSPDPVAFLTELMMSQEVDVKLRKDAAQALLPYVTQKQGTGKKANKQAAAEEVAKGKFSSSPVPIGLLKKAA